MYEITRNVLAEVKKAIVGKDDVISKVWIALLAEGHVLLEDVPGVGKTTMALAFSRALGLDTKRIQFTPDTMPSDIIGFSMPGKDGMVYQPGAIMTNLLLADEINRATPKTQAALLEAMQEHSVTVGGETHALSEPYFVLATQNPMEQEGTYPLPEAQLDRFMLKILVDFPTLEELAELIEVDPAELKATVERYNKLCKEGEDKDFYKENHFLFPVEEGPFTACMVAPGLLAVCGGIHISDNFEVLNENDEPIPGLYAIGNCAGDIYAVDYPINIQGNSHGRCLVQGKCLGEQLAGVYQEI